MCFLVTVIPAEVTVDQSVCPGYIPNMAPSPFSNVTGWLISPCILHKSERAFWRIRLPKEWRGDGLRPQQWLYTTWHNTKDEMIQGQACLTPILNTHMHAHANTMHSWKTGKTCETVLICSKRNTDWNCNRCNRCRGTKRLLICWQWHLKKKKKKRKENY